MLDPVESDRIKKLYTANLMNTLFDMSHIAIMKIDFMHKHLKTRDALIHPCPPLIYTGIVKKKTQESLLFD